MPEHGQRPITLMIGVCLPWLRPQGASLRDSSLTPQPLQASVHHEDDRHPRVPGSGYHLAAFMAVMK